MVLEAPRADKTGSIECRADRARGVVSRPAVVLDVDSDPSGVTGALNGLRDAGDAQNLRCDIGHPSLRGHVAKAQEPVDGIFNVDERVQRIRASPRNEGPTSRRMQAEAVWDRQKAWISLHDRAQSVHDTKACRGGKEALLSVGIEQ